jgi:hypothetical protein
MVYILALYWRLRCFKRNFKGLYEEDSLEDVKILVLSILIGIINFMGCSPARMNPSYENPYIEFTTNSQKLPPSVLEGFGTVLQSIKNPIECRNPRRCIAPKNSKVEEDESSSKSSELAPQGSMYNNFLDVPSPNGISKRFMGLRSNKSAEFMKSISRSLKMPLRAVTPQMGRNDDMGRGFPEPVDDEMKDSTDYENMLKNKATLENRKII